MASISFVATMVLIEEVFMRNSDDCIAIYCHRWDFYGDCKNVIVRNSSLWADVAHPILLGTHGNPEPGKGETLENMIFQTLIFSIKMNFSLIIRDA